MELKPCPFCGSNARIKKGEPDAGGFYVVCANTDCYCELGFALIWSDVHHGLFGTGQEAIEAWNTRHPKPHTPNTAPIEIHKVREI